MIPLVCFFSSSCFLQSRIILFQIMICLKIFDILGRFINFKFQVSGRQQLRTTVYYAYEIKYRTIHIAIVLNNVKKVYVTVRCILNKCLIFHWLVLWIYFVFLRSHNRKKWYPCVVMQGFCLIWWIEGRKREVEPWSWGFIKAV